VNVVRGGAAGANWASGITDKRAMVDQWARLGLSSKRKARSDSSKGNE
jgi:hypothetical protein